MKDVVEKHEAMGVSSPLNNTSLIDMADFKQKMLQADALREESIRLRALSETKMSESKTILGTNIGQTISTEGTLFYLLNIIKRILLIKYNDVPVTIDEFGFRAIVGTAHGVGRKKKVKV